MGRTVTIDNRLTGRTAENIFPNLVNQRGMFATSFDTEAFDGIVFDPDNDLFKVGRSPFFVQIKCRGSNTNGCNSRNFPNDGIRKVEGFAENLGIPSDPVYSVVGFYKENGARVVKYFGVPFFSLGRFRTDRWHNFSVKKCEAAMEEDNDIFRL